MQNSNATLEPFPTLKDVITTLLNNTMDCGGHGDFWDMCKVIYSSNHEEIVKELISQAEQMNDFAMLQHGRCPECASGLVNRYVAQTEDSPAESWLECPECRDEHRRRIM
jgi:hypothetical protein